MPVTSGHTSDEQSENERLIREIAGSSDKMNLQDKQSFSELARGIRPHKEGDIKLTIAECNLELRKLLAELKERDLW